VHHAGPVSYETRDELCAGCALDGERPPAEAGEGQQSELRVCGEPQAGASRLTVQMMGVDWNGGEVGVDDLRTPISRLMPPRLGSVCPACGSSTRPLLDIAGVPALCGVTWDGAADARRSPVGPMALRTCDACAHVFNAAFDPALIVYDEQYDNTLHHSPTFRAYAHSLAERLSETYSLSGKRVVELGCGKGEFLTELCALANCYSTGFDPSYEGEIDGARGDGRLTFVREFMTPENAPPFDFFLSRHVLEHLEDPSDLLRTVRDSSGGRTVYGYLEVPDAMYDFERSGWDCIYPHVSYFSSTSLRRLVERAGFRLLRLVSDFAGQFLGAEVVGNGQEIDDSARDGVQLARELETIRAFPERYRQAVSRWREFVGRNGPERTALWGAGARGVAFLNAVDPDARLGAVVDLNPAKWHRFLPVAGHEVIPPHELGSRDISAVVLTNPNYENEVSVHLRELGVNAEVVCA
jgi:SAM-dependent methyltransferase